MPGSGDPDNRRMMIFDGLSQDQQWLHDRVAALTKLRHDHTALWRGSRTTVSVTDDTYVYEKSDGADVLYIAINRADVPNSVTRPSCHEHRPSDRVDGDRPRDDRARAQCARPPALIA